MDAESSPGSGERRCKVNPETLCTWSAPREVATKYGARILRTAPPSEAFSAAWKSDKEGLKALGLGWSKDSRSGEWQVCLWQNPNSAASKPTLPAAVAVTAALTPDQEARLESVTAKLLPYQVESVRRQAVALLAHGGALDASDTGTGKTFVNLATCYVLDRKPFIVCPKAVVPSWKRAATHFGIPLAGVCNYERLREGVDGVLSARFSITEKTVKGQVMRERELDSMEWLLPKETVIIYDEIHRCKDYKTLNAATAMQALRQGYKVLGLSATAADNPLQMKVSGLLTKCFLTEKGYFPWMMKHGVYRGRFGLEFNESRAVLDRIHQQIFPVHGTRIKIADLGDQFPETQITAEAYDVNGGSEAINRIYEDMAEEIAKIEASEREDKGACLLVARLRARQRSEILKVPAIADMAQDAVDSGMSVAVFVNFDDSADALMKKLKTHCCIRGGQTAAEREQWIQLFQDDDQHVIVCNIKAGGVGVSLHGSPTSRMRMSIIVPTDSAQDAKQACGRVWRANGAKSIQKFFFAAGTIEEFEIMPNMREKIARIDTLNDGDLDLLQARGPRETLSDADDGCWNREAK